MTGTDHDNDWEDIAASLKGDGEAYRRLVVRYQHLVAAQMRRFSRDPGVLEELVQEVFIQAYQSLEGFKRRAPFLNWLRRIATRVGYHHWKAQYRRRLWETNLEESGLELPAEPETLSRLEAADTLHRLFGQMSPEDRLVLTLFYLEDCNSGEIAQRTGWSVTGVKVRMHRARHRLKALLKTAGLEED